MERSVRSYRLCTERCLSWQKGSLFQTMEGIDTIEIPPLNCRILKKLRECEFNVGIGREDPAGHSSYTVSPLGQ